MGAFIRAIDVVGNKALIGLGNGSLLELNLDTEDKKIIIESHCEGETWGLAMADNGNVITSGDDN
jgi:hypothetical protein